MADIADKGYDETFTIRRKADFKGWGCNRQRAILREAAATTQEKEIAEHPSEVGAGIAWCADGGSFVMASEEQVAAFEAAAQPVFDKIAEDPLNVELIAAIRDLKAKTEPSPAAKACAP